MKSKVGRPSNKKVVITRKNIQSIFNTSMSNCKRNFTTILTLLLVYKQLTQDIIKIEEFGEIEFKKNSIVFRPNSFWKKVIDEGATVEDLMAVIEELL